MSSEWKEVEIGSLCSSVCSGGTPKSTVEEYYGGDIPWLNTKEIDFNRIYDTEKHITHLGLENSNAKWIKKNSVIVAMYGATAAKVAMNMIDLTTNQACCNLTIDESKANPKFVYYSIFNNFKKLLNLSSGAAQQNLNSQVIKEFLINVPSLKTQNKIVNLLSNIDNKIEKNQQINQNLESLAENVFKNWFVDCAPFKSKDFKETKWGLVPKNWKEIEFGDLIYVNTGKRPNIKSVNKTEEFKYPIYGASSIMGYVDEYLFDEDIFIIGRVGTHGIVQRVNCKSFPSDNTLVIKSNYYNFIYQILKRIDYDSLNIGSTQPLLTQKSIKKVEIILPFEDILRKYESFCEKLFNKIDKNNEEIVYLTNLRDTLLPKLMSGEIDVSDVLKFN